MGGQRHLAVLARAAVTTLRGGMATAVLLLLLTLKIKSACQPLIRGHLEDGVRMGKLGPQLNADHGCSLKVKRAHVLVLGRAPLDDSRARSALLSYVLVKLKLVCR